MRKLVDSEAAVLTAMIHHAPADIDPQAVTEKRRAMWLEQVPHILVVRHCGCGTCPSITLTLDNMPADTTGSGREVLIAYDVQQHALVLVHIVDDIIQELEVAPVNDDVVTMPDPATLDFSGWSDA